MATSNLTGRTDLRRRYARIEPCPKTQIQSAYFAGLIDGEANIGVYTFKNLPHPPRARPVIKVDMTCEKTIRALHAYFGGYCGQKKTQLRNQPQWRWEVTFQRAREVAKTIRPYLITKAEAVDAILAAIPAARVRQKNGRFQTKAIA